MHFGLVGDFSLMIHLLTSIKRASETSLMNKVKKDVQCKEEINTIKQKNIKL